MSATIAKTLGLTPAQASAVESEWERRSIRAGEVIVEKDEKPSFLAIVLSGSLSLISLSGSDIQLGPGEVVGEVAFLTHAGRTAQVVAREDGEIAVMRYDALQAMERSDPALALQMIKEKFQVKIIMKFPECQRHFIVIYQPNMHKISQHYFEL